MDVSVVDPTQEQRASQARLAAVDPVVNMMSIDEASMGAPGPATSAVADPQSPAKRGRDDPRLAPDVDGLAAGVVEDRDDAGVTQEASRRLRRDSVAERGVALKRLGRDMDRHLDRRPDRRRGVLWRGGGTGQ